MSKRRLQQTGRDSFFGDYMLERIVPQDHFLRHLRDLVPWEQFSEHLLQYYQGRGERGRPPYDPAIMLKILLLSYIYALSERQVVEFCNLNLAARLFLGLAVDSPLPDHSALTIFKKRLLENGHVDAYELLLTQIIAVARNAGVQFGTVQLIDSTHSVADVNTLKDKHRQDKGCPPRDPDARTGCKGKRKVRDENGVEYVRGKYFFGFKCHASFNAQAQMITSLIVTPGNAYDGHYLLPLIHSDLDQGIEVASCAADRGYDDGDNHFSLQELGIKNAIHLKRTRTKKKDSNTQIWLELKEQPWYRPTLKLRYQIERKFGEAKAFHGLGRCRYVTRPRYAVQAFFTAMALNLKQLVRQLTGVSLRAPSPKHS